MKSQLGLPLPAQEGRKGEAIGHRRNIGCIFNHINGVPDHRIFSLFLVPAPERREHGFGWGPLGFHLGEVRVEPNLDGALLVDADHVVGDQKRAYFVKQKRKAFQGSLQDIQVLRELYVFDVRQPQMHVLDIDHEIVGVKTEFLHLLLVNIADGDEAIVLATEAGNLGIAEAEGLGAEVQGVLVELLASHVVLEAGAAAESVPFPVRDPLLLPVLTVERGVAVFGYWPPCPHAC